MRLFFGISLPDPILHAVSSRAAACRESIPGRYVREENYHITLAFLGDVPEHRVCKAADVLKHCLYPMPSPTLTLGETAYFGRAQNAILIARVISDPPLDPLHEQLCHALEEAGLPFDPGPFSPHITLARHAQADGVLFPPVDPLTFIPNGAHLYLSARNEQNILTYTPISSASFCKNKL